MYPLSLNANYTGWKMFSARKADKAFLSFAEKVWSRDGYTCQFCGFQAKDYQEVVNLDQDYYNNRLSNLVTACCFCTQCFFIESVGVGDFGGGTLIYLPESSQIELNSFCHVLFCAIVNDTGYKNTSESIYRSLKFRSQAVEQQFGEGCSDPAVLGQLLIDGEVSEKKIKELLADVRLLPSRARFRKQIEHWAASAFNELTSES